MNVLRQRKKRLLKIEKTKETFHAVRNTSWLSLSNLGLMRSSSKDRNSVPRLNKTSHTGSHPEGPHIGYDSNSSWYIDRKKVALPSESNDHRSKKDTSGGFYITDNNFIKSENNKLLVVMVGLPSSGKTYIARKIARYLRWIGLRTRAFSLAKYRLDKLGTKTADFFDPSSATNYNQRVAVLIDALDDTLRYLSRGGDIAIIDGTNTTRDRRKIITDKIAAHSADYDILWIEILQSPSNGSAGASSPAGDTGNCDASLLEGSASDTTFRVPATPSTSGAGVTDGIVHQPLSSKQLEELAHSPDFLDKEDYEKRMAYYRSKYQTLEEDEGPFIKFMGDVGKTLVLHDIHGFLSSKIVSFVMNVHTDSKPVFITRHGESDFNAKNLIGGDCGLTERGLQFAKTLGEFMMTEELSAHDAKLLRVWTSTMRRARDTASEMNLESYYGNKVTELRYTHLFRIATHSDTSLLISLALHIPTCVPITINSALAHSLIHPFIHSFIYSFIHSFIYSLLVTNSCLPCHADQEPA